MANYSKMIAPLVAMLLAYLVNKFALPAEWAVPDGEVVFSVVAIINALFVWRFPANQPPAA